MRVSPKGLPSSCAGVLNTIDAEPPTSSVTALPTTSQATFTVSWSGSDRGSGVDSYDVYVSEEGGPFQPFLQGTTLTSAMFQGEADHRYQFVSVARDLVGHIEDLPAKADAETTAIIKRTPTSVPTGPGQAELETDLPDGGSPLPTILGITFGLWVVAGAGTGGALVMLRRTASNPTRKAGSLDPGRLRHANFTTLCLVGKHGQ